MLNMKSASESIKRSSHGNDNIIFLIMKTTADNFTADILQ